MQGQRSLVQAPCRPIALLCEDGVSASVQPAKLIESINSPTPSSNEVLRPVAKISSTVAIDSGFYEPTQDSVSDTESCSGLTETHTSPIDLFSVH